MKLFIFSDLHASYKQLANIANFFESINSADALIFAGDVVNMGEPIGFINRFIEVIGTINKPFFWVPGNNDFGRGYYKLKSTFSSLEGDITKYEDITLCGVGGSPASWSGQYAGEKMIDKKKIGGSIFVSHFPPPIVLNWQREDYTLSPIPKSKNDVSSISDGILTSSGKAGLLRMTKRETSNDPLALKKLSDSPLVHICGHIHHQWGVSYLGSTKVIKLGAAELGHYAILDVNTLKVDFCRF